MMSSDRIYLPVGIDGYELCHPVNSNDFERINVQIDGSLRITEWTPILVRVIKCEGSVRLSKSDSPWLGDNALIFRKNVVKNINIDLKIFGELLPLICEEELFIFNPKLVVNAIDESESDIRRFDSGKIMAINRYKFNLNAIKNAKIFKISNLRVSPTFVTGDFVEAWRGSNMTGLDFKEVA